MADSLLDGHSHNRLIRVTNAGTTTLVSAPDSTTHLQIFKVLVSPAYDTTAECVLKLGNTEIAGMYEMKKGGVYSFLNCTGIRFELGNVGEDLTMTVSYPIPLDVNVSYDDIVY